MLRMQASNNRAVARKGMRRNKRIRGGGVKRHTVIVSERLPYKTTSDAIVAPDTAKIKAIIGSKTARNGTLRRKRLLGVDRQATIASGMPVNKTIPNTNAALARMTCPANVKTGSVAVTTLTIGLCDRMKKKKAMANEPIEAEKILVNSAVVGTEEGSSFAEVDTLTRLCFGFIFGWPKCSNSKIWPIAFPPGLFKQYPSVSVPENKQSHKKRAQRFALFSISMLQFIYGASS
jgi:hypothetical protein